MSVRSDVGVCAHCGVVQLASQMVRLDGGEYRYACSACAAKADARPSRRPRR